MILRRSKSYYSKLIIFFNLNIFSLLPIKILLGFLYKCRKLLSNPARINPEAWNKIEFDIIDNGHFPVIMHNRKIAAGSMEN